MNVSQLCGIIVVILVIAIIFCIWYFGYQEESVYRRAISSQCKLQRMSYRQDDFPSDSLHPRQFPVYDEEEEYEYGGRKIGSSEALVIYGKIPKNYLYWGITGYKCDDFSPVGDSVSIRRVKSLSIKDGVAVILLSNPSILFKIKRHILEEWSACHGDYPISFYPIYVTSSCPHTLLTQFVLRNINDPLPSFKCKYYKFLTSRTSKIPKSFIIDRDAAPKEQDSISETDWKTTVFDTMSMKNYEVIREIPVYSHIDDEVYSGEDRFNTYRGINGGNRDFLHISTGPFKILPGESITVIAIDHVSSDRSSYSRIGFKDVKESHLYASYITGDPHHRIRNTRHNVRAHVITHTPGVIDSHCFETPSSSMYSTGEAIVNVIETIGPEPMSDIGPHRSSILPCKVFVIKTPQHQ